MKDQTKRDVEEALRMLKPAAGYIATQEAARGNRLFAMLSYRSGPSHDERWSKATDKALANVRQMQVVHTLGENRGEMMLTLLSSEDVGKVPFPESYGLNRAALNFAPTESVTIVCRP